MELGIRGVVDCRGFRRGLWGSGASWDHLGARVDKAFGDLSKFLKRIVEESLQGSKYGNQVDGLRQ